MRGEHYDPDDYEGLYSEHALFSGIKKQDAFVSFLASRWHAAEPSMSEWHELMDNVSNVGIAVHAFEVSSMVPSVPPWQHKKIAKGREIPWSRIKGTDWEAEFHAALSKEWGQWLQYEAVKRCADAYVPSDDVNVLIMRIMCTDKLETERGSRTYQQVPLQAKCRIVVQGPRETLGETEQRDTSSATLPEEALHVFFTIAVSMGWTVQQGDVEAAFLNGLYDLVVSSFCRLHVKACRPSPA